MPCELFSSYNKQADHINLRNDRSPERMGEFSIPQEIRQFEVVFYQKQQMLLVTFK
jgi:hypothetical protein